MQISPLLYGVFWLWLLVGVILAGVIWSLLWLVHYLTTPSETGHGVGGMSSITRGLRPIGKRSLRMFHLTIYVRRAQDFEGVYLVKRISSSSDGLEPIHIMITDVLEASVGSGRKQEHGIDDQGSLRSSYFMSISPDGQWQSDGSASWETRESS